MSSSISRRDFVANTVLASSVLGLSPTGRAAQNLRIRAPDLALCPVSHLKVTLLDSFWGDKQSKVAKKTVQAIIYQTEKTGRIRNFEKAARRAGELPEGLVYNDSDVYKALELIAYSLSYCPDAAIERKADEWIDKIAAAQLPDGYLNTYFTLTGLDRRWTDMSLHEDYCAGHLIEGAIAYFQTTGKRKLLDVAIRFADHIDLTLRLPNRHWVCGHEEIEMALVKLSRLTSERKYLQLAEWCLDQRGRGYFMSASWPQPQWHGEYNQDDIPVREQRKITGHAVRAMYLYTGVADVAAMTGDSGYMQTLEAVWDDLIHRQMYVTGGVGSASRHEGFGDAYDLPNRSAYCETCASVGMVLWSHRMNLLTGESQYVDVLERSLYNAALAGISLSGDRFFYTNPLAASKPFSSGRQEWFDTACCPSNVARLISSIGGYIFGVSDRAIWINLYAASTAKLKVGRTNVSLRMDTTYPWSGNIKLSISPERQDRYALHLRVPSWARNVAVPGGLYQFNERSDSEIRLLVNGRPFHHTEENGYITVNREWAKGDIVELSLPMPVRTIVARDEVKANRDRIALQRGPLMYCVESIDNGGNVWNILINDRAQFSEETERILDEPVVAVRGSAAILTQTEEGDGVQRQPATLKAIPYYAWANRESYDMQVWLPTKVNSVALNTVE
jgi:uncharacterized protein